jgi:hypothetical protein
MYNNNQEAKKQKIASEFQGVMGFVATLSHTYCISSQDLPFTLLDRLFKPCEIFGSRSILTICK